MAQTKNKKCWLATVAAFVVINVLEFLLHHFVLGGTYKSPAFASLWNPETVMKGRMWAMFAGYVILALVATSIYARGYEPGKAPVGQGLRFGLAVGAVYAVVPSLMSYMVYPVTLGLATAWMVGGLFNTVVMGVAIALVYRPETA